MATKPLGSTSCSQQTCGVLLQWEEEGEQEWESWRCPGKRRMVSEGTWGGGVTTGPEHLVAPGTAVLSLVTKTQLQACKCSILVIADKTIIS